MYTHRVSVGLFIGLEQHVYCTYRQSTEAKLLDSDSCTCSCVCVSISLTNTMFLQYLCRKKSMRRR